MSCAEARSKRYSVPGRAGILLFVLSELGQVATGLKLQKLVFQVQNRAKIPKGYRYFRHYYGPYSRELDIDTITLAKQGLIKREELHGARYAYLRFEITPLGRAHFEKLLSELTPEGVERMREVLNEYKGYDHYHLVELVYRQWKIDEPDRLCLETESIARDLEAVGDFWETLYFPDCPAITFFLAFIDYCRDALSKLRLVDDPVVRSVLVSACRELHERLANIAQVCSKQEVCPLEAQEGLCRTPDPSLIEVFDFIEDFCERNGILPRLLNRKLSELVTEDEYKRLQESLKTMAIPISS